MVLYGGRQQQRPDADRRQAGRPLVHPGHRRHIGAIPRALRADDPPLVEHRKLTESHGTTDTSDDTPDLTNLYWNMSVWGNYNVVLMQTDLTPMKTTLV